MSESQKIPHDSAIGHVTGTSEFIDDRPFQAGELHVGVFASPHARARIKSLSFEKALQIPGVVGIYSAKDLHENRWGTIFQDQPVLAEKTCEFAGEPILVIAGEDRTCLEEAKREIEVEFEVLEPILSISRAIEEEAFIGPKRTIQTGDVEEALNQASHRIKSRIRMAGQDHFYLESQASVAYPKENGQIEVHSSSQHPTEVQHVVAESLGLKFHQVVCIVKRMGGGFGGKESQAAPFAAMAALVAQKTGRAARVVLTKDEDMAMTGKRNPFQNDYEVGFDNEGQILALKVDLFSDGGAYADLSTAIMERAMLHMDNAYYIPNALIRGQVCKTNTAPNTAFRGFGGPKGVLTIENILEEIAQYLGMDSFEVRKRNVYGREDRNKTPYGQLIRENTLPDLFEKLEQSSNYSNRRKEIQAWNESSKDTLKGLSMTAVKFGISFTTRFLNQGSALVNIHLDGTAQVSTGATEMGQGTNTKIAQVVAETFGIPFSDVQVMATSTEKIHNTAPSAASSCADINGSAAFLASQKLRSRLAALAIQVFSRPEKLRGRPTAGAGLAEEISIEGVSDEERAKVVFQEGQVWHRDQPSQKIAFTALLDEAFLNRVSLGERGYYRYPGIHYNKEKGQGEPFFYYTCGTALSEVSLHRFTGEFKLLRADLLMDLGRPIHREIDLGQVKGAFIQGLGWVSTENLYYNDQGVLQSISPSTYKIPSIQDIPREFRVDLIENPKNTRNLRASKAVGEPPLLLAISAWTAVKDALRNLGSEKLKKPVSLNLPATQEEILSRMQELSDGKPFTTMF